MVRGFGNLFEEPDDHLQKLISKADSQSEIYLACIDILHLRRQERLVEKTGELVKETQALVKKTWWLAFATWALAAAAIVTILIQIFCSK